MIGARVGIEVGARVGGAVGAGADPLSTGGEPPVVINIIGDSNGSGIADIDNVACITSNFDTPYSAVRMSQRVGSVPFNTYDEYEGALAPRPDDQFGIDLGLGHWVGAATTDTWRLSKMGVSGASLAEDYLGVRDLLSEAVAFAQANAVMYGASAPSVWVDVLGANDADNAIEAAAYGANLLAYIARVRAEVSATIPIIIVKLPATCTQTFASDVISGQDTVEALALPGVAFVSTTTVRAPQWYDGLHFTADGYVALGKLVASAVFAALSVSAPSDPDPLRPPSITTNKSAYAQGEDMTLTWYGLGIGATSFGALDFLGISLAASPSTNYVDPFWCYTNGTQSSPGFGIWLGNKTFTSALAAGTYVARMWSNDDAGALVAQSAPFTVAA